MQMKPRIIRRLKAIYLIEIEDSLGMLQLEKQMVSV